MILYEANAGTGKTFRINTLILEGLLKKNYQPQEIMATTFTVKGASEIRNRLMRALKEILKGQSIDELREINIDVTKIRRDRIIDICNNIDKLFIGTIHSWCLRFLKIFPTKVTLPPYINIDEDKNMLNYFFDKEWNKWVYKFIDENPKLVAHFKLESIRNLAKEIVYYSSEMLDSDSFTDEGKILKFIVDELRRKMPQLKNIKCSPYQLTEEEKLVYRYLAEHNKICNSSEDKCLLLDWIHYNDSVISILVEKINALVDKVREDMLSSGYVNFDALLYYTRDVLANNRNIRNFTKSLYKLILVDEAQDTSPIQYEIIFYISEKLGEFSRNWRELNIESEKLIIVGDPKQSIYSFRGADIRAYKEVFKKAFNIYHLTKNTRSCKNVLQFTNDVAQILFEKEGIECQPSEYFKKDVKKIDKCEHKSMTDCVRIVNLQMYGMNIYEKVYKEAIWIANDINRRHKNGEAFGNFAILLRKIQRPYIYIDVFTNHNIPFVIESDKYFYQTQEVIDFINLINYIIDPKDKGALAGLMRSPILACSDYELLQFFRDFDADIARWPLNKEWRKYIFDKIEELHKLVPSVSFSELIDEILKKIPALELLQICYKKEIVPFNILRFRQRVLEYELLQPQSGRMEFKKHLIQNCRDIFDIGQEPLFDEKMDAVKILSIHKSKGLEFPIVYFPCIDVETPRKQYREDELIYDGVNNRIGIRCNGITNKNYLELKYLENIDKERGDEEKRVFYVAITRAMEQLVITYSAKEGENNSVRGNENVANVINLIRNRLNDRYKFEDLQCSDEPFNESNGEISTLHINLEEVKSVLQRWENIKIKASGLKGRFVSVSELSQEESALLPEFVKEEKIQSKASLVGVVCHYVLSKVNLNSFTQWENIIEKWMVTNGVYIEHALLKEVESESKQILRTFFNNSDAYLWLCKCKILGREIPILYRTEENQVSIGVIDLLAERDNKYYLVDYKTAEKLTQEQVARYSKQLECYAKALDKKRYKNVVKTLILLKSSTILFLDS